ncbi:DUF4871 domain-containing protein [Peribacillus sp. SCS-37]|uniref:DUF4871 domain-containing protein n=1 Tax=Paraperibacillus esterisolvens TaxID=3115296 RepID=UPI003905EF47
MCKKAAAYLLFSALLLGTSACSKEEPPLTNTFETEGEEMRGIKGRIGISNNRLMDESYNKVIWHFWGDPSNIKGEFKVIGTELKSGEKKPVLLVDTNSKERTWSYKGNYTQPNLGAVKTMPSALWFDNPGKWMLEVYINGEHYEDLIVNVSKNDVPSYFSMSVMKNIEWMESPVFPFETMELRGEEGKLAILSTPWKAGIKNKYMWHFFGEEIPSGKLTVVAVKKGTNEISKALVNFDTEQQVWTHPLAVGSAVNNHTDVPASMKLPSSGMWTLNAYIDEGLFGQIVVDVK